MWKLMIIEILTLLRTSSFLIFEIKNYIFLCIRIKLNLCRSFCDLQAKINFIACFEPKCKISDLYFKNEHENWILNNYWKILHIFRILLFFQFVNKIMSCENCTFSIFSLFTGNFLLLFNFLVKTFSNGSWHFWAHFV
jgi:hypothetical protein